MKNLLKQISILVEELLGTHTDLFLVDILSKKKDQGHRLIVLLDGDQGVSVAQCAHVSREISRFMDEQTEVGEPLTLEVSSAGLDHPIRLHRQYVKNIGKNVKVTRNDRSVLIGCLEKVEAEDITISILTDKREPTTQSQLISFKDINKTIVLVSF